jgi:HAD superfamily hydrolase (TIGR01450 family)
MSGQEKSGPDGEGADIRARENEAAAQWRSFEDLADDYPVIFFDAYGVLLEASGMMTSVPELVDRMRAAGKDIYVVTNDASRSVESLADHYVDAEGRQLISADRIISSGSIAAEVLSERIGLGRVGYLGTQASSEVITRAGMEAVAMEEWFEGIDLDALALLDDEGFEWQEGINRAANLLRRRPIPTVVANGDLAYPVGKGRIAAAIGTVANALEGILDVRFIHCAKPDAAMFSRAFRRAEIDHQGLRPADVLMVGDTLQTDIRGGKEFGLATALVCSGHTQASRVDSLMQELSIFPDYLCESVFT